MSNRPTPSPTQVMVNRTRRLVAEQRRPAYTSQTPVSLVKAGVR